MEDLKGLILSGGRGARVRAMSSASPKQLGRVANKPVLFYGIEAMADAGIREVGIIIAPETGAEIREAAGDGSQFGGTITYIVPDEPPPEALILLTRVPDPQNCGVAELGTEGNVVRLVEKPPEPATDLALVGVYMFTPLIHDAARAIKPSGRGELEITDAIQHLVDTGARGEPHVVQAW